MAGKGGRQPGAGRPKGAKSSKTLEWEVFSEYCMTGGLVKFKKELNKLKDRDFVESFLKLLEFHKPKLSRTAVTDGDGGKLFVTPEAKAKSDQLLTSFLAGFKTNKPDSKRDRPKSN